MGRGTGVATEAHVVADLATEHEQRPEMHGRSNVGTARRGVEGIAEGAEETAGDSAAGTQRSRGRGESDRGARATEPDLRDGERTEIDAIPFVHHAATVRERPLKRGAVGDAAHALSNAPADVGRAGRGQSRRSNGRGRDLRLGHPRHQRRGARAGRERHHRRNPA